MSILSTAQPYPGLRPFDFGDREYFFGREAQIRSLRDKLAASRLVAVVGRSGCGKSSLVRAGLIPMLLGEKRRHEQLWRIATFRPQGRPMEELAKALLLLKSGAGPTSTGDGTADPQGLRLSRLKAMLQRSSLGLVEATSELGVAPDVGILIVIDQFEEIFRYEGARGSDLDEATAFVRLLVSAAAAERPRIHVLLTMRLDFLGDCARFQGLPEALSDGQFLVPNLNRAQRREAIEEPARRCGATISPAVTQRLLNEVGEDPDELPVLQHVLMRTWQQARGSTEITSAHYEATGGIHDAISRHADDVYDKLPSEEHRQIAERLLKAASELDRRARAIRRSPPVTIAEVAAIAGAHEDSVMRVVAAFRAPDCCFLMPPEPDALTGATGIDISHESLLRRWTKLTGTPQREGWLAEEDRDGKTYRRLAEDAETFATDRSALLPAKQARQAVAWWKKAAPNAAWAERYGDKFPLVEDFLRTSTRRELVQRSFIYAGVAVVALSLASALITLVLWRADIAEREQHEKADNASSAQSIEFDRRLQLARQEWESRNDELRQQLQQLQRAGAAATPRLDDVIQVAKPDPSRPNDGPAGANQQGFIWLGSVQKSNLQTPAGEPISPTDVRVGDHYLLNLNVYLRSGLPDAGYNQQPSVAVVAPNTRIELKGTPVAYDRPTGKQYWASVRVVSLGLPTVYFQFYTASREQAQAVAAALQAKGYRIPGEERLAATAGQRQVRYFYAQDKAAALKLAADVNAMLQGLGYQLPSPVTAVDSSDSSGKKNPAGVVELWLDLPAK